MAPSETAIATVASEPPRIPVAVSTVTREKETVETTATVTHQHIPSNMEILNNPETFRTHLAEIDHTLNAKIKLAESKTMITDGARYEKTSVIKAAITDVTMITSHKEARITNGPQDRPPTAPHDLTAQSQWKWKRIFPAQASSPTTTNQDVLSSKRKLDDTEGYADSERNQKLDTETRILSRIFAEHLGSEVAAMQHHQVQ